MTSKKRWSWINSKLWKLLMAHWYRRALHTRPFICQSISQNCGSIASKRLNCIFAALKWIRGHYQRAVVLLMILWARLERFSFPFCVPWEPLRQQQFLDMVWYNAKERTNNEWKKKIGLVPLKEDTVDSFQALEKIDEENHVTLSLFNEILS